MPVRTTICAMIIAVVFAPLLSGQAQEVTEEQRRELERIATLGYLTTSGPAPVVAGVTVHEPEAYPGYTIYVSRGYPGAFLIDMNGEILHTWNEEGPKEWARVWVYPDGSVVAISTEPDRIARLAAAMAISLLWAV